MGGLLSRLYAQEDNYLRAENFNEGDIRRLVTLTAPHFGTNFANLLVALHSEDPEQAVRSVENVIPNDPKITRGAVCDLAENSLALLKLSSGTPIPAHIVTATGGPSPGLISGTFFAARFWPGVGVGGVRFNDFESELTRRNFSQETIDAHRFREQNDALVPLSSQLGGIPEGSNASLNFPNLLHFNVRKYGTRVVKGPTGDVEVANHVFARLDEIVTSDTWQDSFPGVQSDGTGVPKTVPGIPGKNEEWYNTQCIPGGPMKPDMHLQRMVSAAAPLEIDTQMEKEFPIRISNLAEGQVFYPNDSVLITVEVDAPLIANDIAVRLLGLGQLEGVNYDGSQYQASFTIPETFIGPITIIPAITDEGGNSVEGSPIIIAVHALEAPEHIYLVQRTHSLDLSNPEPTPLRVIGVYSEDDQRAITSPAAETTYFSNNPDIVAVDLEGRMTPIGIGTAVITVENRGSKDFAIAEVTQDDELLPPESVVNAIQIQRGGLRLNRQTGFFVQQIQLTNVSGKPILGPLYMVIRGLPNDVELINRDSLTENLLPTNSPYLRLDPLSFDGLAAGPGQSFEFTLEFLNPNRRQINYDVDIIRTSFEP